MEALGVKLRKRRRRIGLTLDELASRIGISKPYLSLIETGRVPNPPSDEKLRRLEQSLGFEPGELVMQAHLHRTPADVRAVLGKLLESDGKDVPGAFRKLVDRSDGQIAPMINGKSAGQLVGCPEVFDKGAFAARVQGDSMASKYGEGDIVIFSPALPARSGDDCFIRFADGRTTFKRVFFEVDAEAKSPVVRLQPRNEKYRPEMVRSEEVSGMYRAAYRYQRVNAD